MARNNSSGTNNVLIKVACDGIMTINMSVFVFLGKSLKFFFKELFGGIFLDLYTPPPPTVCGENTNLELFPEIFPMKYFNTLAFKASFFRSSDFYSHSQNADSSLCGFRVGLLKFYMSP